MTKPIDQIHTAWVRLNEYESQARVKASEREALYPDRDPTMVMVQEMTGRLARIEERLQVTYWLASETYKRLAMLGNGLLWGVGLSLGIWLFSRASGRL